MSDPFCHWGEGGEEGFDGLPSLGAGSSAGMGYRGLPAQT